MFLYDDTIKLYKFSTDHVKTCAEELKEQGSCWNETQLQILLEAITSPIEELLEECIKHNELNRSIYILNSLKKVNDLQQDDRVFANYMVQLGSRLIKNNPLWLAELRDTLSILYRLCLGRISQIARELKLLILQAPYECVTSDEQEKEVQQIIADQLTLVLDVLSKNTETPTSTINSESNNFFNGQQSFFSSSSKQTRAISPKIKPQEAITLNSNDAGALYNQYWQLTNNFGRYSQNGSEAEKFLIRAADLGHAGACYTLAHNFFRDKNSIQTNRYIKLGLAESANHSRFDTESYKQAQYRQQLEELNQLYAVQNGHIKQEEKVEGNDWLVTNEFVKSHADDTLSERKLFSDHEKETSLPDTTEQLDKEDEKKFGSKETKEIFNRANPNNFEQGTDAKCNFRHDDLSNRKNSKPVITKATTLSESGHRYKCNGKKGGHRRKGKRPFRLKVAENNEPKIYLKDNGALKL